MSHKNHSNEIDQENDDPKHCKTDSRRAFSSSGMFTSTRYHLNNLEDAQIRKTNDHAYYAGYSHWRRRLNHKASGVIPESSTASCILLQATIFGTKCIEDPALQEHEGRPDVGKNSASVIHADDLGPHGDSHKEISSDLLLVTNPEVLDGNDKRHEHFELYEQS